MNLCLGKFLDFEPGEISNIVNTFDLAELTKNLLL